MDYYLIFLDLFSNTNLRDIRNWEQLNFHEELIERRRRRLEKIWRNFSHKTLISSFRADKYGAPVYGLPQNLMPQAEYGLPQTMYRGQPGAPQNHQRISAAASQIRPKYASPAENNLVDTTYNLTKLGTAYPFQMFIEFFNNVSR